MCGGIMEYRGEEDIPQPRTAEEIYAQAKKKNGYRTNAKHSTGTQWIWDYMR